MLFLLLNFRLQTATSMLSHHEMHEEVFQTKTKKRQQNAKRRTSIRLKARQKLKDSRSLHQLPTFMDLEEDEINAIIDKMEHITRYSFLFLSLFLVSIRVLCFFFITLSYCYLFCFVSVFFFSFVSSGLRATKFVISTMPAIPSTSLQKVQLLFSPFKTIQRCSFRFGLFSAASLF